MNRKPKLAPGSRWEDDKTVIDRDDTRTCLEEDDDGRQWLESELDDEYGPSPFPADALAVIRAAKLDPVFDSAVALAEWWDKLGYLSKSHLESDFSQELCNLLDANSAAVKGATDAV